jgi:hypothetical protein
MPKGESEGMQGREVLLTDVAIAHGAMGTATVWWEGR